MKPRPIDVRSRLRRHPESPRAAALVAAVALGLPAWAQLGSYNHEEKPLPAVTPAGAELIPAVPLLESTGGPLQSLNDTPAFPALVSRLFANLLLPIPDNSSVGVADERTVVGVPGILGSLQVQLALTARGAEPMYNGDLFVTLSHSSGYAVLLNRPGRGPGSAAGYADNGLSLTLADTAAADVHTYRLTLTGSELVPLSLATPAAPLTGTWQPDGRTADPETAGTGAPRITSLAAFNGMDPNGTWTLFVADLGAGGLARIESWGLEFTVVPEPEAGAAATAAALLLAALLRRRRQAAN